MSLESVGIVARQHVAAKMIRGEWLKHPELRKIGLDALKAHRFTCTECGVHSRPSVQVPHGWMVPATLQDPGLVPGANAKAYCPFCLSAQAINWSVVSTLVRGVEQTPGYLIHCPWIPQHQLNRIAFFCCALKSQSRVGQSSAMEAAARSVDSAIVALREEVKLNVPIHRGTDSDYARALSLLAPEYYEQRQELVGNLRFWPSMEYWAPQGDYWFKAVVHSLQDSIPVLSEAGL